MGIRVALLAAIDSAGRRGEIARAAAARVTHTRRGGGGNALNKKNKGCVTQKRERVALTDQLPSDRKEGENVCARRARAGKKRLRRTTAKKVGVFAPLAVAARERDRAPGLPQGGGVLLAGAQRESAWLTLLEKGARVREREDRCLLPLSKVCVCVVVRVRAVCVVAPPTIRIILPTSVRVF